MIFITLSDGIITKKMAYSARLTRRNEGYEKNEIFYTTDLIKVPNLELVAKDGGITMVGAGQFTIEVLSSETGYDSVVDFSSKDLSVVVQIWDEDDLSPIYTVLTGRAYLGAMNRKQYTYRLKSEKGELANDLLNPAPDIRQNAYLDADKSFYFETVDQGGNWSNTYNDNRLFPMRLGILKHMPLFPLAYNAPVADPSDSVGEYYADGTVKALYDNGLKIRFSQYTGDYRILKNNALSQAVYELTMDIDGDDTAVNSDTTSPNPQELTTTFAQSTEPAPADVVLKDGMIWIDTTGSSNIKYIYQNGAWVKVTVSLIESTDFVDIPTGTGFRLKANAADTAADPTIFGAYIKGGTLDGSAVIGGTVTGGTIMGSIINGGASYFYDGTETTSTKLIVVGAYLSSQTSVTSSTRLSFDITNDGKTNYYDWNTSTNLWELVLKIGVTNDGSDLFSITSYSYTGKAGIKISSDQIALSASSANAVAALFIGNAHTAVACQSSTSAPLHIVTQSSAPTTNLAKGMIYFNGTTNKHYGYDGTTWNAFY